jgi:general secretion pathway protein M
MTTERTFDFHIERYPLAATTLYVVLVAVFAVVTWLCTVTLMEQRAAVDAARDLLAQLDGRHPSTRPAVPSVAMDAAPAGSAFLEGETVTVAGAALLQRVAAAVARAGGNVLSSQVDVQGTQSKEGYVSLIASCQVDQAALQQLLYDLEAGMPFLFIDQLVAHAPIPTTEPGTGRMRITLAVSGQWEVRK